MKKYVAIMLIFAVCPLAANADNSARERSETVQKATKVYDDIVLKSPNGAISKNITNNAKCIAVFPEVITAAAVVGGMHGDGVVSCKNNGKWSTPVLVGISGASLGAQLGGKSTDLVLFLNNEKAVSALKRGTFKIGADASVAVGKYDAAAEMTPEGVVAFQRNEGGYLGVSIAAGNISLQDEENRAFYGNGISSQQLLNGSQVAQNTSSDNFLSVLPNA